MRTVLYSLTAVACVSLVPVAAASQSDANVSAKAKADEEVVCRYEVESNSRLGRRRVCRTRAEWTANTDATQRSLQQRGGSN